LGSQRINHFDGTTDHCNGGLGNVAECLRLFSAPNLN
jgi:hypothetical protein